MSSNSSSSSGASPVPPHVAVATDLGGSRNTRGNQDKTTVIYDPVTKRVITILCDGHGLKGHEWAEETCKVLAGSDSSTDPKALLAHVHDTVDIPGDTGGTTVTYAVIQSDGSLVVANLGDSACKVYDTEDGVQVTKDHSPSNLEEYKRIVALGGECLLIGSKAPVFVEASDGSLVLNKAEIHQVKNIHHEPGCYLTIPDPRGPWHGERQLAMSRAIGDRIFDPYLSNIPDVAHVEAPVAGTQRVILIASDGLWDCMTDPEISAILRDPKYLDSKDATGASKALMKATLAKGYSCFGNDQDNTTLIVVYV
jgi:serine/threonine protein phosphatase PrpC